MVEVEKVVEEDLKDEIDEEAKKVKDEIPDKVKKIRNEVVKEVTGKKFDDIVAEKQAKAAKRKEMFKQLKEANAKLELDIAAKKTDEEDKSMKETYEKEEDESKSKSMKVDDSEPASKAATPSSDDDVIDSEETPAGEESVSEGKSVDPVEVDVPRPERASGEDTDKGTDKDAEPAEVARRDEEGASDNGDEEED